MKEARHKKSHIEWFPLCEMFSISTEAINSKPVVITGLWGAGSYEWLLLSMDYFSVGDDNIVRLVRSGESRLCEYPKSHWI